MQNLTTKTSETKNLASAGLQLVVCAIAGIVGGVVMGSLLSWKYSALAAWDVAASVYLLWIWLALHAKNGEQTAALAVKEDPGSAGTDIVLVFASVASLAAVGVLFFQAHAASGISEVLQILLGIISVVISWAVVHTIYALKYARIYYKNNGGIDFYSSGLPRYSDFAYVAFTIGMTFQVSDNNFTTNEFRKTALRHALLAYIFGTVIFAATINLIAGLGK